MVKHTHRRRGVGRDRAAALVVLSVMSAAWTSTLVGMGSGSAVSDAEGSDLLPDGAAVPSEAVKAPASYSRRGGDLGLGVPKGSLARVVRTASTNGIPTAALEAYKRAETVINAADKGCNIAWQLVAAIGRVESDHGRYGGNSLDAGGVSRPGIYGIALDGTRNTAEITDTDAGQFDNDTVYDRAVGPMQFIPSTWSVVGVDADGDAKRDPQDIDDAALAAAVYLCSGSNGGSGGNLGTDAGRRASVYRYNHSEAYVDLVLSIMDAYMSGDYTSVPNYTTSAITFTPAFGYTSPSSGKGGKGSGSTGSSGSSSGGTGEQPPAQQPPAQEQPPATQPPTPQPPATNDPAKNLQDTVKETVNSTVKDTTKVVQDTVTTALSLPQAILRCTAEGHNPITTPAQWNACITRYTRT